MNGKRDYQEDSVLVTVEVELPSLFGDLELRSGHGERTALKCSTTRATIAMITPLGQDSLIRFLSKYVVSNRPGLLDISVWGVVRVRKVRHGLANGVWMAYIPVQYSVNVNRMERSASCRRVECVRLYNNLIPVEDRDRDAKPEPKPKPPKRIPGTTSLSPHGVNVTRSI
ncbi:hypothetical protein DL546_009905 [Coniochaeta pulveracea]|uniref:Ribonucleotide reductase large subunit domain-containing protein n=1 Tax=Coniochaeta pulveracea TaxID=177199 RepID=A0A420YFT7_9PEZI|nr:hypothetical protein DL546_009905 [Coniochaeta pulveracea]